jgi:hypothetical protein
LTKLTFFCRGGRDKHPSLPAKRVINLVQLDNQNRCGTRSIIKEKQGINNQGKTRN